MTMAHEGLAPLDHAALEAGEATREELIMLVCMTHDALGATPQQLQQIMHRSRTDGVYYQEWCGSMDQWYPEWRDELMRMRLCIDEWRDPDVE